VATLLTATLNNAYRLHGVGDPSVWRRMKPIKIPKTTRSRLFIPTEQEVKDLIAKCEPDFVLLVRAALLTGARYGELTALEARDFDSAKGTLDVRGKTGERTMMLSSAAVAFFSARAKGKLPRAKVFTTAEGGPWLKSMQHRRMRAATSIRPFVFYSLRHYALSRQLSAGIPSALVAKNAGTSEAMLRAHYHKFIAEDRSLFDRAPAIA
jgi:integrase